MKRSDEDDARDLLTVLEQRVLPLYYGDAKSWARLMRFTISLVASFFNTQRMLHEYLHLAYRDPPTGAPAAAAAQPGEPATETTAGPPA
jgi:glucan phosphorylase